MYKEISSTQNHLVKRILTLKEKSKRRLQEKVFVVEGQRELELAKQGGFKIQTLCYCPKLFDVKYLDAYATDNIDIVQISQSVYNKLAYRGSTEGVIGIVEMQSTALSDLKITTKTPLILVAESPEKPGNIGALLRTADAANVDAVIIANPTTDIYNPNVVRSSVGGLFSRPLATGTSEEVIDYLLKNNVSIYSAILQNSISYDSINFCTPTAIVVGTESTGLSKPWRTAATQCIHIPMLGLLDSMNVSVAAGILLFEAKRQRGFILETP